MNFRLYSVLLLRCCAVCDFHTRNKWCWDKYIRDKSLICFSNIISLARWRYEKQHQLQRQTLEKINHNPPQSVQICIISHQRLQHQLVARTSDSLNFCKNIDDPLNDASMTALPSMKPMMRRRSKIHHTFASKKKSLGNWCTKTHSSPIFFGQY